MENGIKCPKCPKCNSTRTRPEEGTEDFLSHKGESDKARKQTNKINKKYFCWDCEHRWEGNANNLENRN